MIHCTSYSFYLSKTQGTGAWKNYFVVRVFVTFDLNPAPKTSKMMVPKIYMYKVYLVECCNGVFLNVVVKFAETKACSKWFINSQEYERCITMIYFKKMTNTQQL
jgi:ribosomal protein S26